MSLQSPLQQLVRQLRHEAEQANLRHVVSMHIDPARLLVVLDAVPEREALLKKLEALWAEDAEIGKLDPHHIILGAVLDAVCGPLLLALPERPRKE